MKEILKKSGIETREFQLKILTPVHVGSGEKLDKIRYIYNSNHQQAVVIDEQKFIEFLHKKNLMTSYLEYLRLHHKKEENSAPFNSWLKKEGISDAASVGQFKKYVLSTEGIDQTKKNLNEIECCIKSVSGQPYLPGSSIKGAVRTAIGVHYLAAHRREPVFRTIRGNIDRALGARYPKRNDLKHCSENLENQIFLNKIFGISIGDTEEMPMEQLCLVQKRDYSMEKKKQNTLSVYCESLKPGVKTRFTITVDRNKSIDRFDVQSPEDILPILEEMEDFLYGKKGIYGKLEAQQGFCPDVHPGYAALILGKNTGFHSKTLLAALYEDPEERLRVSRQIMNALFQKHHHYKDLVASPPTVQIARYKDREQVNGFCEIALSGEKKC